MSGHKTSPGNDSWLPREEMLTGPGLNDQALFAGISLDLTLEDDH